MRSINILIIALIMCVGIINAQPIQETIISTPVSFRSQALGGVVFDNLDLVYDPIELRFVEGIRIYTNLSNLTSSQEQILNGVSDNEFLLGMSGKSAMVNRLWHSLLVRFQNSRFSNPFFIDRDLDGFGDFEATGQFNDIYTAFIDNNGDGLYDIKRVIEQEKRNFDASKMNQIVFTNSYVTSNWTLGLRLAYGKSASENTIASGEYGTGSGPLIGIHRGDPETNMNFDLFSVEDNFRTFNQNEAGRFLTKDEQQFWTIHLAAMGLYNVAGISNVELRTDLAYHKTTNQLRISDGYTGSFEDFHQDNPQYLDKYSEQESNTGITETDGKGFVLGFSAKRVFAKGLERKDDGFWQVRVGLSRQTLDYRMSSEQTFSSQENFFDGTDTLSTDFNDANQNRYATTDDGTGTNMRYFASGVVNVPLGERVHVGMGLALLSSNLDRTTVFSDEFNSQRNYEELDTLLSNDFQQTSSQKLTADREFEQTDYRITFPVGIEYKFTNNLKWSLRFGSIFTYRKIITNDAKKVTATEPLTVKTEYGDGQSELEISDNVYESTSSHTKNSSSVTTFVYGLGFSPTEHLQIDLLGFLGTTNGLQIWDADFFKSLRLSFSLKL